MTRGGKEKGCDSFLLVPPPCSGAGPAEMSALLGQENPKVTVKGWNQGMVEGKHGRVTEYP